ncbi:2-oxoacid:acceptor oxidoreductase family protein [Anaerolentibacter hominis]|uniref:2-oxoacid:acceptor oxidoreductase family protein n=1 Tax=Anaerolentibacter hominis TaxID=3079009 RepID=UPI0031B81446
MEELTVKPLPETNDRGYYEMRLESIGGLGANLCGKLLGELGATYLGYNSSAFSSYGSEKRGSPVKAFIRWCAPEKELRINSPVENPHILGIFHEAVIGKLPVTAGVLPNTKIVINTDQSPEQIRESMKLYAGELFCVDALKIAMESKSRINMVMLGAIAKAAGFFDLDPVLKLVEDTLGKKYPALLSANLEGVKRGYENASSRCFAPDGQYEKVSYQEPQSDWGYANAPIGGVNTRFGSIVSNDLSASREGYFPIFLPEKCINCGLCDSTCPDMVFQFKPGEYKGKPAMVNMGLDYYHCKGCLRCVEVCPTNALVMGKEREHPDKTHFLRNQDLVVDHLDYERTGANSWVTSESYTDERRIDGGIV